MLDRHGSRSSEHWTEAAAELLHGLRQTTATLRKFYSLERLAAMMEMPLGPDGRVDIPDRLCSDRVLAGQAGAFLHILASQSDRYRIFHGSIQEALMKMVADLIAFHQHERVLQLRRRDQDREARTRLPVQRHHRASDNGAARGPQLPFGPGRGRGPLGRYLHGPEGMPPAPAYQWPPDGHTDEVATQAASIQQPRGHLHLAKARAQVRQVRRRACL